MHKTFSVNITYNENSNLDGYVNIELQPENYQSDFNKELKNQAKKADLKGFRKGMVPAGVIKKMYGKSILAEYLMKTAGAKLQEYLQEKELKIIGQPLLEEHDLDNADVNNLSTHNFKFHIGFHQDFEIPMLKEGAKFPHHKIKVSEEDVDKEIERIKNDNGDRDELKEVDEYKNNDIIEFDAVEISENGEMIEGGHLETGVRLLFEFFKDEETSKKIAASQPGDTLEINFPKAVDKTKEDLVKNLFKTEKQPEEISDFFKITINKVERLKPAELNEDLFKKLFPEGDINDEEGLRAKLREEIGKTFDQQTKDIRKNFLQMELVKSTDIPLPDAYIKKHIEVIQEQEQAEKGNAPVNEGDIVVSDEDVQNEMKGIKWDIIRSQIVKDNDLQVNRDDLKEVVKVRLLQSMNLPAQYADAPFMDDFAEKTLKDKKQAEQYFIETLNKKVIDFVAEKVEEDEKEVTLAEFQEIYKKKSDEY